MESYSPSSIEKKWQKVWEEKGLYQTVEVQIPDLTDKEPGSNTVKPKFYVLVEFPYPSGAGLHVGHVRAWSCMDAYVRKKRMEGKNVLFPIGWDAFGLPAENYALKTGVHPSKTTQENIKTFKNQIKALGLSFDWSREINTTNPEYYRWTQWIFLKLLEKGLAYRSEVDVNWCSACKTNLADEEVLLNGTHERCGNLTQKRKQKQWLLAITKYADRLIEDLKLVDFPDKVSRQQINWIGRREGVHVDFKIVGTDKKLTVFTTAHDTIFGATFMVISPEHPLVAELLSSPVIASVAKQSSSEIASGRTLRNDNVRIEEIRKYVKRAKSKSEQDRIAEGKEKTGVDTGLKVVNPFTNGEIPLFVADYVLMQYGTGAVVGVPGHDKRDHDFAEKFNLPVRIVMKPVDGVSSKAKVESDGFWDYSAVKSEFSKEAILFNSGSFSGLNSLDAKIGIEKELKSLGIGEKIVNYHLHDWVFSRQHYWGEPIPVIYCRQCRENSNHRYQITNEKGVEYAVVPVPEAELPVELPYVEKYEPSGTGESPLSSIVEWVNTKCPNCGGPAKRETDTMPNWAGSNWYFLRYLDPQNDQELASRKKIEAWMPVDVYEGGYEHTTLHLLYSRFIYKFLHDIGVVPTSEPYAARRVHGIVLGPDNRKMSKSLGNVVSPDEIVSKFGADSLRLYEMFMGPFAESVAWNVNGVVGVYRFLSKVWNLFLLTDFSAGSSEVDKSSDDVQNESPSDGSRVKIMLSKLANKVSFDLESMKFNTAVSSFMEFTNEIINQKLHITGRDWDTFLRVLAPLAPHFSEELYQRLVAEVYKSQNQNFKFVSIHNQSWPIIDDVKSSEDLTIAVQVDGKIRDIIKVVTAEAGSGVDRKVESEIKHMALNSEKIKRYLEGKTYRTIYVPGKVINFVTSSS